MSDGFTLLNSSLQSISLMWVQPMLSSQWYHGAISLVLWAMKLHGISLPNSRRKVVFARAAIFRDHFGRKGWGRAVIPRHSQEPLKMLFALPIK